MIRALLVLAMAFAGAAADDMKVRNPHVPWCTYCLRHGSGRDAHANACVVCMSTATWHRIKREAVACVLPSAALDHAVLTIFH